jgi:hypothetical protein
VDPLARAYAVLEIQRGCTPAELKKRYRDLVRRWHPDRHAGDAAGQAEATARLREINGAFRTIARAMGGGAPAPSRAEAPRAQEPARSHEPERPLRRSEIDALVAALKAPGPVDIVLDWAEVVVPMAAGLVLLMPIRHLGRPNTVQALLGAAFLALGLVLLLRWRRRASE